jgi:hypothetical protein
MAASDDHATKRRKVDADGEYVEGSGKDVKLPTLLESSPLKPLKEEKKPEQNLSKVENSDSVFNQSSSFYKASQEDFDTAEPFRHIVVKNFLDPEFAREIRRELLDKVDVKFKETDLFKFHQTKDISSLLAGIEAREMEKKEGGKSEKEDEKEEDTKEEETEKEERDEKKEDKKDEKIQQPLPYLKKLSEQFYSEEFRNELSKRFGLGKLTNRVDMAAQAYTTGCHLM